MKLYLRVCKNKGYRDYTKDERFIWDKYGGVCHAMWDKQVMTEREICWSYMMDDLDDSSFEHEYFDKSGNSTSTYEMEEYLRKTMIKIQRRVKAALVALIKIGFVKEL
jgi:hypothetical protein